MSCGSTKPIVFYDIAFKAPRESTNSAPNPWKSRLALNFKGVPYTTTWVPLPDVEKVRRSVKLPPCRQFGDGSDYYTLPMMTDPNTDDAVGDSFDIAVYLQKTYPDSGSGDLFPEQKLDYEFKEQASGVPLSEMRRGEYEEYARFNKNVDAVFTAHVILMVQGMPLEPAGEQVFVKRAGVPSFDAFACVGEQRSEVLAAFEKNLKGLSMILEKDKNGPFVLGNKASYADLIIGGWLRMASKSLQEAEWDALRGWHGGVFGQLHDGLDRYAQTDKGQDV